MSKGNVRAAGIAALVFVALTLVAVFATGEPPAADDAVAEIRDYLVDHRSTLLLSNLLGLVAIPFVIWFGTVMRQALRRDRTADAFGTASLAGLILAATMAMAGGAVGTAPVYVDGVAGQLGDDTIRFAYEAQTLLFAATSAGFLLFGLTTGLAIQRTRGLPIYLAWLAYLVALGNLVALVSTAAPGASALGLFGVLSFVLFVLIAGIVMIIGRVVTPVAVPSAP